MQDERDKPRSYADAVEKQADFEELTREDDSYERATRDEAHGKKPRHADDEAVSGT
jgi:hypothetical protein